jgi:DNA-binding CsgD family transcriptional regulator
MNKIMTTANYTFNSGIHLSRRELQCLQLSILGKSARKAGIVLGLSQRTVEGYLNNVKKKLAVKSKSEMIEAGLRIGITLINT